MHLILLFKSLKSKELQEHSFQNIQTSVASHPSKHLLHDLLIVHDLNLLMEQNKDLELDANWNQLTWFFIPQKTNGYFRSGIVDLIRASTRLQFNCANTEPALGLGTKHWGSQRLRSWCCCLWHAVVVHLWHEGKPTPLQLELQQPAWPAVLPTRSIITLALQQSSYTFCPYVLLCPSPPAFRSCGCCCFCSTIFNEQEKLLNNLIFEKLQKLWWSIMNLMTLSRKGEALLCPTTEKLVSFVHRFYFAWLTLPPQILIQTITSKV